MKNGIYISYRRWATIAIIIVTLIVVFLLFLYLRSYVSEQGITFNKPYYILSSDSSLNFELPTHIENVRIIVRPVLNQAQLNYDPINYTLHYSLINRKNQLLEERNFYIKQELSEIVISTMQTRSKAVEKNLLPMIPRILFLPTGNVSAGGKLKIKLAQKDSSIHFVLVRVQYLEHLSKHKLERAWWHLPQELKHFFGLSNVYSQHYMRRAEKLAAVAENWMPLAPTGIDGKDFDTTYVATKFITDEQPGISSSLLENTISTKNTKISVYLPKDKNHILLTLEKSQISTPKLPTILHLHWESRGLQKSNDHDIKIDQLPYHRKLTLPKGVASFYSKEHMLLNVTDLGNNTNLIELASLRTYFLTPQSPVTFSVAHEDNMLTPFRISLRLLNHENFAPTYAICQLFDKNEKLLQQKKLLINSIPSENDIYPKHIKLRLSDPINYYLMLSPKVKQIKIFGPTNVLVNAFIRPMQLTWKRRIPQDFYSQLNDPTKDPGWFTIEPKNVTKLINNGRSQEIKLQKPLEKREPYILEGTYDVDSFFPVGLWHGIYLVSKTEHQARKIEPGIEFYHQFTANKNQVITFSNQFDRKIINPSIIINRKSPIPDEVTVILDGKVIAHESINAASCELSLYDIQTGTHTLLLKAKSVDSFFLNYTEIKQGSSYVKKIAYKIDRDHPLKFIYHKKTTGASNLGATLYFPHNKKIPFSINATIEPIRASIEKNKPMSDWTFKKQQLEITPDKSGTSIAINKTQNFDAGQSFALSLGADLATGDYLINITTKIKSSAYLTLVELVPKQDTIIKFYRV